MVGGGERDPLQAVKSDRQCFNLISGIRQYGSSSRTVSINMFDSDPVRSLLEELQVMEDNAVTDTLPQVPPESMPSQSTKLTDHDEQITTMSNKNRLIAEPSNVPFISWTDGSFHYTVQNLTNRGETLLQLQYTINGYCTNSGAVYLNLERERDKQIYFTLRTLLLQLENLWVESENGLLKTISSDSLITTVIPLTGCRRDEEENFTAPSTSKRRKCDSVSENVRKVVEPPSCNNTVAQPLTPPLMSSNKKPCHRCGKLVHKSNVPRHTRSKACSV